MSHAVYVSDETYRRIETLAQQQGTTPETLAEALLKERLAERLSIARQNADWQAHLNEALDRAAHGENTQHADTEAFFAALDAIPSEPAEGHDA
ncbi:MAG: hypothetical protein ABI068_10075 [Ktedonobacterales bacterium]